MEGIEILKNQQQIERTRILYEQVFTEDSKEFVDYYYAEKTKDNMAYICGNQDQIIAMLHLNPFEVICGLGEKGRKQKLFYIAAVATKQEYRHKGYMDCLLRQALQDMAKKKQAFTFLMPAHSDIYKPYQFSYIYAREKYDLKEDGISKETAAALMKGETGTSIEIKNAKDLRICIAKDEEFKELAEFSNYIIANQYGLFCSRSREYYERLQKELESQNGTIFLLKNKNKLIGYFFYTQENHFIQEVQILPEYNRQDFFHIEQEKKPIIMARILCLEELGKLITAKKSSHETVTSYIEIEDSVIEENNGIFRWSISSTGSVFLRQKNAVCGIQSMIRTSADKLTSFLFGYQKAEGCFENLQQEQVCFLEKIQLLENPYINEMV